MLPHSLLNLVFFIDSILSTTLKSATKISFDISLKQRTSFREGMRLSETWKAFICLQTMILK